MNPISALQLDFNLYIVIGTWFCVICISGYYHLECIGLTQSDIISMPDFKCPSCKNSGTNSPFYKEGDSQ